MSLLAATDVRVTFGGVHAVDGVSMTLEEGQLVGLIGPNGAGKTTFIDALSGFVRASGEVVFDNTRIDGLPPYRRSSLGLTRTFQTIELFDDLTVHENLQIAASRSSWWTPLAHAVGIRRSRHSLSVDDAIDLLDLGELARRRPTDISLGQQKRVAVARALASSPRLVLLDEPAAGLDSNESRELGQHLRKVCDAGLTMLLVDHDMGLVLGISDYVYVLDSGRLLASGTAAEIKTSPPVVKAYLGTSSGTATDQASPAPQEDVR